MPIYDSLSSQLIGNKRKYFGLRTWQVQVPFPTAHIYREGHPVEFTTEEIEVKMGLHGRQTLRHMMWHLIAAFRFARFHDLSR